MASDLFSIRVLAKQDTTLRLTLAIISADCQQFVTRKEAALVLLAESAMEAEAGFENTKLGQAIGPLRQLDDTDWYLENAKSYIASFKKLPKTERNFPVPKSVFSLTDDAFQAWWENETNWPLAEYELKVKKAEHIAHLEVGDVWNSATTDYL